MYLMDYHTHSILSADGHESVSALAAAGIRAGLSELAVTDHHDLDDDYGSPGTDRFDAAAALAQLKRLSGCKGTG
jgi:histidinol-phosphatase (PHP family)